MARTAPSIERATGMLEALKRSHTCTTACNGTAYIGGQPLQLRCPYEQLDPTELVARRIIGALYADAALDAMGRR